MSPESYCCINIRPARYRSNDLKHLPVHYREMRYRHLKTELREFADVVEAARFANIVGALSVTRLGPMEGAPTRAEVERYL